jgi:hypothetical protein
MEGKQMSSTIEQTPAEKLVSALLSNDVRAYIASKTKHAARWRALREQGFNIISTWIDEAGPGESSNLSDLATRRIDEARTADRLILYCEPEDVPLKGALIEIGAALSAGVLVYVVGYCDSLQTALAKHPLWIKVETHG